MVELASTKQPITRVPVRKTMVDPPAVKTLTCAPMTPLSVKTVAHAKAQVPTHGTVLVPKVTAEPTASWTWICAHISRPLQRATTAGGVIPPEPTAGIACAKMTTVECTAKSTIIFVVNWSLVQTVEHAPTVQTPTSALVQLILGALTARWTWTCVRTSPTRPSVKMAERVWPTKRIVGTALALHSSAAPRAVSTTTSVDVSQQGAHLERRVLFVKTAATVRTARPIFHARAPLDTGEPHAAMTWTCVLTQGVGQSASTAERAPPLVPMHSCASVPMATGA